MSYRSKRLVRNLPKCEQESHISTLACSESTDISTRSPLLSIDDYEAPPTADSLPPNSKWIIVRNNIHKIRSWGVIRQTSMIDQSFRDWYLFFQMRRELKRAEEEIRAIEHRPDFIPVRYFDLPLDETRVRRYNVSHVRSNDGVYYGGLGTEPIVLEYLLYYFSRECPVPYNSMFYSFLSDVTAVLYTNRQRLQRVVVFRRVALIFTSAIFILILLMFFTLILSVLTTASNLRQMYKNDPDGGMIWQGNNAFLSTNLRHKQ
jgi:hypothetical protein